MKMCGKNFSPFDRMDLEILVIKGTKKLWQLAELLASSFPSLLAR
jgi:hypothetical protein